MEIKKIFMFAATAIVFDFTVVAIIYIIIAATASLVMRKSVV